MFWLCFILFVITVTASADSVSNGEDSVVVRKCCFANETMLETKDTLAHCSYDNSSGWSPHFVTEDGKTETSRINVTLLYGMPDCGPKDRWPIYHYPGAHDELLLLKSGKLRHIVHGKFGSEYYDHDPESYCMDTVLLQHDYYNSADKSTYALVCVPEIVLDWHDTDFIITKIVNPVCHAIGIMCLLATAVLYFVVPQLRDLVGTIIITLCLCLIVSYSASMVNIFNMFSEHISFLVADITMYMSLLAAFFWLNSMGYYVWKAFRSRNVFLRATDQRKYCYYSLYSWGCTLAMAGIALFAHFMLDTDSRASNRQMGQQTVGWLGIAVFFTPIAFTILVNIFFYLTTGQAITRLTCYGRIHQKLKFSFEMFIKLFLVMAVTWLFLLLSWLKYSPLQYLYVTVNALQAPLIFYICICQRRVTFLLKKYCCHEKCISPCCRPEDNTEPGEWGEEMLTMNTPC